jgi:hypothetical protein
MAYSTIINTQPSNLPKNYRSLANTIGLDRPLADIIQFGRLYLSSIPNILPQSVASSKIPPPSTLKRPIDLAQHGRSHVQTSSSSTRNRVITQPLQPVMNPIIMHSPVQHAVNTIGTQHHVSSQLIIPPSGVLVQQPTVIVPQSAVIVPHQPQLVTWAPQSQHILTAHVQPYFGKVHQPLVEINSPPLRGQYTLWGQAPVTGGETSLCCTTIGNSRCSHWSTRMETTFSFIPTTKLGSRCSSKSLQ